eukprot:CAMPEP_0171062376 /NCGR_PEP_ID=MMETSP0766_2-20121228/5025_1 /TAXON_ID=439317 /ORGANISM="Gambierdiscus australes, Strain CAWD 149" /LENGTH=604 /DNA_ID=CAMNT_0011518173 /DNA_START=30 /DNA_END=1844 /DNA_ORIENTATION=+
MVLPMGRRARSTYRAMLAAAATLLSGVDGASAAEVLKLNASDIDSYLQQGTWFVKFFEPWCKYCQRIAPAWQSLGERAKSNGWPVQIAEANCRANWAMAIKCRGLAIQAFPTVILFRDGMLQFRYVGPITVDGFENWLRLHQAFKENPSPHLMGHAFPIPVHGPTDEEPTPGTLRSQRLVARISVGSPPQALSCLVHSGLSHFWVPSKRCHSCGSKRHFWADNSSTFQPHMVQTPDGKEPRTVHIHEAFTSGSVSGYVVQDTVSFGSVQVKNQTFIIAESEVMPPHRTWDGVCGLGWGVSTRDSPLYRRLQQQGRRALFAIVPSASKGGGEAQVVLGEVPDKVIKDGTLAWVRAEPLVARSPTARPFWITAGGLAVHRPKPVKVRFLINSGTDVVLLAPPRDFFGLLAALLPQNVVRYCGQSGRQSVTCSCSTLEEKGTLPLRIYLGRVVFQVPFKDLFMQDSLMSNHCRFLIQPNMNMQTGGFSPETQLDEDLWVLGGGFLERHVTIFDFDKEVIGFGQLAEQEKAPAGQCVDCWEEHGSLRVPNFQLVRAFPARVLALGVTAALLGVAALGFLVRRLRVGAPHSMEENFMPITAAEDREACE